MHNAHALVSASLDNDGPSHDSHLDNAANDAAAARAARLDVAVTLERFIAGDIQAVFDFVAAQDVLPKILTRYGLVPGVASTSDVSGPWDQPGSTRTVHLLDGSTLREGLTHHARPTYFAYRISEPSFSLKHLMSHARGQ